VFYTAASSILSALVGHCDDIYSNLMLQCKKHTLAAVDNASAEVSAALQLRIPFFLNTTL
jgi:hypothetical protein